METTSARIVAEARRLIMQKGYNGFSYADISEVVGVRKASIHHHFSSKSDLAKAVIEQSRTGLEAQAKMLREQGADGSAQLRAYAGYWERCIGDGTAPFCVAAMLAAELPSLPEDVAFCVRVYFAELAAWLAGVMALGVAEGKVTITGSPQEGAEAFLSAIYGAMLSARAFADPKRFSSIAGTLVSSMVKLN